MLQSMGSQRLEYDWVTQQQQKSVVTNAVLCVVAQSCLTLGLHGLWRLLCLWRFSRQEYWSGFPCPPPEDLPNPGFPHCRQILYHLLIAYLCTIRSETPKGSLDTLCESVACRGSCSEWWGGMFHNPVPPTLQLKHNALFKMIVYFRISISVISW